MRKKKKETITTIRIWGSTKKKLDLKKQNSLESYNEVIQKLLEFHDETFPKIFKSSETTNVLSNGPVESLEKFANVMTELAKQSEKSLDALKEMGKAFQKINKEATKRK